jgi:hypothetical protein
LRLAHRIALTAAPDLVVVGPAALFYPYYRADPGVTLAASLAALRDGRVTPVRELG